MHVYKAGEEMVVQIWMKKRIEEEEKEEEKERWGDLTKPLWNSDISVFKRVKVVQCAAYIQVTNIVTNIDIDLRKLLHVPKHQ